MFVLREQDLLTLWKLNHFPVPSDKWVFFGLRGCELVDDGNLKFAPEHGLRVVTPDHIHPRCVIGQWAPGKGIAVFPASTVPHLKHVRASITEGGRGTNQLITGCYEDYRKGCHKGCSGTGHQAFRQNNKLPVQRSADDTDYDADDRVEYGQPFDNLHAGWCQSTDSERFASAGCQVLVGFPKCDKRGNKPDTGPWAAFKENAYSISQQSFYYVLLNGRDAERVVVSQGKMAPRLRFGSKSLLVTALQNKLKALGHYEGDVDDDFGIRTLRAVMEFQTKEFGPTEDDGIVGPQTASAIPMDWPGESASVAVSIPPASGGTTPAPQPAGKFHFDGKAAVAPDGTRFAKKFKKGVFNFGATTIGAFVRTRGHLFAGLPPSLLRVMEAVSANEGKLEAINTWDNAFLTFGIFQWTAGIEDHGGELPALVDRLKREFPAVFDHHFGQHGLSVTNVREGAPARPGITPTGFFTLNGTKLAKASRKEKLRELEWAYRFWLAGQDDAVRVVQIRQAMDRIRIFYDSPKHLIDGKPVSDYVKSEYGVALLLDQHVNRPGHVPKTLAQAVASSGIPKNPSGWKSEHEHRILETYVDLRAGTSMTDSDKRAQSIADAVADGVISEERGSFEL